MLQSTITTKLARPELAYWLREGWKSIYGEYPSDASLGILWAQTALECGGGSACRNYNFGNIKRRDGYDYCMYRCSEYLNGVHQYFDPPHPQTHFVSCPNALEGAKFYIGFLSQRTRYKKAWQEVINGNVVKYVYWLKQGGYFTAPLDKYTAVVVNLYKEYQINLNKWKTWKPIPSITNPALSDTIALPPPIIPPDPIHPPDPISSTPTPASDIKHENIPKVENLPSVIINEPTSSINIIKKMSWIEKIMIYIMALFSKIFGKSK